MAAAAGRGAAGTYRAHRRGRRRRAGPDRRGRPLPAGRLPHPARHGRLRRRRGDTRRSGTLRHPRPDGRRRGLHRRRRTPRGAAPGHGVPGPRHPHGRGDRGPAGRHGTPRRTAVPVLPLITPQPSRTRAPVRSALVYLEQHYRHRISRWQVARAAGVSEDHLSLLFHRELGVPLWEYLTRLRVQRAKERLRHSGDSVQTVARAVGFHDRAYFSRVFRKVTGVAPHAYREVP
ncbi:helix-turn-helix transcriptional regulator [Streptomyces radiopugnans]|nr:helix-turn-helix transcriptional regulator [Streptomyces radiopugnans]